MHLQNKNTYLCNMKIASDKEKEFIFNNLNSDINKLLLQPSKEDIDIKFCVKQIQGYNKAKEKFPSLIENTLLLFPNKLNLEQSSSEETAKYKSSLFNNHSTLRDLSSGFGIDDIFFSKTIDKVYYHEKDLELANIAEYNFNLLEIKNIEVIKGDSIKSLKTFNKTDIIYLDPSRRDTNNNKVILLQDSEPNVINLLPLLFEKADTILLKLSPMLDIKHAIKELTNIKEIHIVSVKNECKELLICLEKNYDKEIEFHCIDIYSKYISMFSFLEEKTSSTFASQSIIKAGNYLYEPNSSIMKAGGYHYLSQRYEINKLSPHSHLFLSERPIENFPGREFIINKVLPYNNKTIKNLSKLYPKANITIRNFPETVSQIRKRSNIAEGSENYLFFTTDNENNLIIISAQKPI